jgi:hypothetical protein
MILLVILVMITVSTGPVAVFIAVTTGEETLPEVSFPTNSGVLGAIPFGDTMDIAQLLDLINIFKGAIQFFETTNRTMSLQEAIQIYRNLNLTIPPLDDSMLR